MDLKSIIYRKEEGIAIATLNRPDRMNALNNQMMVELGMVVSDVGSDKEVRVLVITGAGRGFCAGGDFSYSEIRRGEVDADASHRVGLEMDFTAEMESVPGKVLDDNLSRIIVGIQRLSKPVIASVNGAAVGFGFDLALTCDMRIGSEKSRFRVQFTKLALSTGAGGTWLLPRVVGLPKACELIYTGDMIEGEEAAKIGLLNHMVPSESLEAETIKLARKVADGPPIATGFNKLQIYKGLQMDLEMALLVNELLEGRCLMTGDHVEGIRAFAEKRNPVFKGE